MPVETITCALCGHQSPLGGIGTRGYLVCTCGMRIECSGVGKTRVGTWIWIAVLAALFSAAVLIRFALR